MERTCKKCGETKPIEEFSKSKKCNLGYTYMCTICYRKYSNARRDLLKQKEYRELHKEEINQKARDDYKVHKEKILRKLKEWRDNNKDKISLANKKYCKNNRDTLLVKNKKHYNDNKIKILQQMHKYYELNKDKILQRNRVYANKNKDKIRAKQIEWAQKHRRYLNDKYRLSGRLSDRRDTLELTDNYIIQLIGQNGITTNIIKQHPELIDNYRQQIKLHRLIKKQSNGQSIETS